MGAGASFTIGLLFLVRPCGSVLVLAEEQEVDALLREKDSDLGSWAFLVDKDVDVRLFRTLLFLSDVNFDGEFLNFLETEPQVILRAFGFDLLSAYGRQ